MGPQTHEAATWTVFVPALAALIALCGVIIAGYLSNFVAEDYRRFRDGSSLAAALSGELNAYFEQNNVLTVLSMLIANLKAHPDERLKIVKFEIPPDPVFDSAAKQLGLLGPYLAKDVAYVYQLLRAFRTNFKSYTENHIEWDNDRSVRILEGCMHTLGGAMNTGKALIPALVVRSEEQYFMPHPRMLLKWRGSK
jgi:hypothetical protein